MGLKMPYFADFSIILMRKKELIALNILSFGCLVNVFAKIVS